MGGGKPFDTPRGIEIASYFIAGIGGFVAPTLHEVVELVLGKARFAVVGPGSPSASTSVQTMPPASTS